jgi:hypothetical protein
LFKGKRYKLFQVSNYSDFGYYSGMGKEIWQDTKIYFLTL